MPQDQQIQLAALLQESARSGYPIRAALIASSTDLGSITELWRQPQNYAQFLGQELSLVYRGPLLVVMPAGFGLYNFARPLAAERSIIAGVSLRGGLGSAGLSAIQKLASAAGHPLALPTVGRTNAGPAGSSTVPWIAFIVGAVLIAIAWTASVRARPLGLPGRKAGSG